MTTVEMIESLLKYVKENPELRFWQALRGWSKVDFIATKTGMETVWQDTFYQENNNE